MYLRSLRLKSFRSCSELELHLDPSLTILVGENNAGKTNVIEALRLLVPALNGRRERYPEAGDVSRATAETEFSIEATYDALSDEQKGLLIAAVPDPRRAEAILGVRYEAPEPLSPGRGRTTHYCGKFQGRLEPGFQSLVYHVYLPPLRDAHRALASGNGVRIATLLKHVIEDEDQHSEFVAVAGARGGKHPVIERLNTKIQEQLSALTYGVRPQAASLGFAEPDLLQLARDLRFRLGDHGIDPGELAESGLGYTNLLFMASVMIELEAAREADLTLFLVEEPEAHLHPQLKVVLLDYLKEVAEESARRAPVAGVPAGRIQIVVTTHSSELTSGVSAEHLVVLRSRAEPKLSEVESNTEASRKTTVSAAVCIRTLGLDAPAIAKIDRYLDVTRSALLFSRRVLLVEGIAEALLLPAIAKHVVLKGDSEAYRRFRGCTLVPIDGVDFAPYLEILLRRPPEAKVSIADRVVIVTDGDRKRAEQLARCDKWCDDFEARGRLLPFVGEDTLEADLLMAGNELLFRKVYLDLHPNSLGHWRDRVEASPETERGQAFMELFKAQRTRKGDFAQRLAAALAAGEALTVPGYLRQAIQAAAEHVD